MSQGRDRDKLEAANLSGNIKSLEWPEWEEN